MNFWISTIFGAVVLTIASAQQSIPSSNYDNRPAAPPGYYDGTPAPGAPPSENHSESPIDNSSPPQQCSSQPAQTCGCSSAQPVVINLSCGGGSPQGGQPRPPPPPPPPASSFDPEMCMMDEQGYPTKPELYPAGYRVDIIHGVPTPFLPPGSPRPPPNWDGDMATLGFPLPPPGTPEYNMIMCWPVAVPVASGRR